MGTFSISIHAPPRGATLLLEFSCLHTQFQFTPLREGRRSLLFIAPAPMYFNSRPSARGDHAQFVDACLYYYFNSRPSARGDAYCSPLSFPATKFQFTPLREGRHDVSLLPVKPIDFNSRPSARGDTVFPSPHCQHSHFNSRPSARGDFYIMR